jgi:hypothetical protein
VTKYLKEQLKAGKFTLAHGFIGFSPWKEEQGRGEQFTSQSPKEREKIPVLAGFFLLPLLLHQGPPVTGMWHTYSGWVFTFYLMLSRNALTDTPRSVLLGVSQSNQVDNQD